MTSPYDVFSTADIEGELRDRIIAGVYAPGTQLPSDHTLKAMTQGRANVGPVRWALTTLAQERYVVIVPGVGTFVNDRAWWATKETTPAPEAEHVPADVAVEDDPDDLDDDDAPLGSLPWVMSEGGKVIQAAVNTGRCSVATKRAWTNFLNTLPQQ